jgi:hypothetical protein
MVKRGWTEYRPKARRLESGDALAIIDASPSLRLTTGAVRLLGNPSHVVLLFDQKGRRVGITAAIGEVQHSFPLRRYGGGHLWHVSIGGFRTWANIAIEKRREFKAEPIADRTISFSVSRGELEPGDFEEFVLKGVALSGLSPNASISRNGSITLNWSARDSELVRQRITGGGRQGCSLIQRAPQANRASTSSGR